MENKIVNKKQSKIKELKATLQWKDEPLLRINIENGEVNELTMLEENTNKYPWLMRKCPDAKILLDKYLESQMMPETRQHMEITLRQVGLTEYSWEGLISVNYGLNTDNCYWFKPLGSNLVYDDIKIRD